MEEDGTTGESITLMDIWKRLPLTMKIAIVVVDLCVVGYLIYEFIL